MDKPRVIIRKKEASRRVGLSVRHLERLEAAGRFPKRVKLSENSSGYVEGDVDVWIETRIAASHGATIQAEQ